MLLLGLAAGSIAYATIPDANGVIHGCYMKNTGMLRVIDTDAGENCGVGENPLSWKQTGSQELFANVKSDGTLVSGTATAVTRLGRRADTALPVDTAFHLIVVCMSQTP